MDMAIEIIGWAAAGLLLSAYALLSRGRLSGQGPSFQLLNVVGSLLVGINSLMHEAWPSASVNAVWLVIGLASLAVTERHRREPDDHEDEVSLEPGEPEGVAHGWCDWDLHDADPGAPDHRRQFGGRDELSLVRGW